jgi:hypothetical protein
MKKFFKALAVLILIAHVFAALIYVGIIPIGLFTGLHLPDAGRIAELILRIKEGEEGAEPAPPLTEQEEENKEEAPAEETEDLPGETSEDETEGAGEDQAQADAIRIELSETLPEISEEDLYDLTEVLIDAGALKAVDGRGEDKSDLIVCELAADIENPGHFTAVFSVQTEDGQIERGPSADMRVELRQPFLAFREDEVTISAGEDYDPARNILICMDVDGTVLTEFVAMDGYLNPDQPGDYELRFYIYSRVNGSSASRTMTVHVEED